ncbi:MAG: hypothetical protein ACYC4U_31925, partial [Pirellulaceae bacterium]
PDATAPQRIRDGVNHVYLERSFRFARCMNGLETRSPLQAEFAIVGQPDDPQRANQLLSMWGISRSTGEGGTPTRRREIEMLFLPGQGTFSGRADCNVLIVTEDCPRATRMAAKAHVLVAEQTQAQAQTQAQTQTRKQGQQQKYLRGPRDYSFRLADFHDALASMTR